jgi:murein DD-endopeptidase MepM/ murein hydrolase activator NlpD
LPDQGTITPPDQGTITPPDQGTITPPETTPGTTPDTTPDTTPSTTPSTTPPPAPPPDDQAAARTHDNDIYVGTISTLSAPQRAAIEAFLAATDRLGRAQTALATTTLNPPPPSAKTDVVRAPAHGSASSVALVDSALAVDRAVKRVALRAQETLGIASTERTPDEVVTPIQAAQAAVDAAQADVDHATGDLRAVANGDALITALLTGKPPAGDALAQRIAGAQVGQPNPPGLEGLFALPIPGAPLASPYGFRIDPFGGNVGFHPGIDLSAVQGTPIRAAAAGTVLSAGSEGGYGNAVVLDHGDSVATLYGHMVSVAASPGQHVEEGDVIGYVGSTGVSTGPHLHFEVRVHGVTVDPLPTFKS